MDLEQLKQKTSSDFMKRINYWTNECHDSESCRYHIAKIENSDSYVTVFLLSNRYNGISRIFDFDIRDKSINEIVIDRYTVRSLIEIMEIK